MPEWWLSVKEPRTKRTLRLPLVLAVALRREAEANGRSLNAEIVHRLQASLASWKR